MPEQQERSLPVYLSCPSTLLSFASYSYKWQVPPTPNFQKLEKPSITGRHKRQWEMKEDNKIVDGVAPAAVDIC